MQGEETCADKFKMGFAEVLVSCNFFTHCWFLHPWTLESVCVGGLTFSRQILENASHLIKEMKVRPKGLKNPQKGQVLRTRLDLTWG